MGAIGMSQPSIAIVFSRFGPYHVARLQAVSEHFGSKDISVTGIEISNTGGSYAWDELKHNVGFNRVTLFTSQQLQDVAHKEIKQALQQALEKLKPDCVALPGWQPPEAQAGLWWCKRTGAKAICMSDSKVDDAPRSWWKEAIKKQIVKRFDSALVAGTPHKEYIQALGMPADRVFLGYDVVDNDYFDRLSEETRAERTQWQEKLGLPKHYFLLMTRFIEKKNLPRLLDAYHLYRSRTSAPWDLVMAGSGEQEHALHLQASTLRLEGVHWPGFIQYPEQPRFFGLASAYILPSTMEQWGLVVNEAMAAGLPVLVSRTAGCQYELVEDGQNGFLFDPFAIEDMAACMTRMSSLSTAEREAMGAHSRKIIANWGPERFAQGLWEAVQAAAQNHKP